MSEIIKEQLIKNRSKLSENSLKAYVSTLKNLYKKVYPDDTDIEISKFNNQKKFIDYLKNVEGSKRKSILSALVVLCENNNDYKNVCMEQI